VSPRGDRVALLGRSLTGSALLTVDLAGKATTLVPGGIRGQGLAWSPSGDEIWFDDVGDRGLFLLKAIDLTGRVRIVDSVPVGLIVHDISKDGRVLVERYSSQPGILGLAPGETAERELSWFDRSLLSGLSDDGRTLLINEGGDAAGSNGAYYVRQTDGSPAVKLGEGFGLEISGDGKWVLARPPGDERSLMLAPTGTGTPVTVDLRGFERVSKQTLFPDAKRLLLLASEKGGKRRLYVQDLPSGKARPITDRAYAFETGHVSPDGQWVAAWGEWTEDLFLIPTGGGDTRTVPNTKDLDFIRWTPDGKYMFGGVSGSIPARVVRVEVATGKREPWKDLAPSERSGIIQIAPVYMTPDGKSYVYGYGRAATSDLYIVEGLR